MLPHIFYFEGVPELFLKLMDMEVGMDVAGCCKCWTYRMSQLEVAIHPKNLLFFISDKGVGNKEIYIFRKARAIVRWMSCDATGPPVSISIHEVLQ